MHATKCTLYPPLLLITQLHFGVFELRHRPHLGILQRWLYYPLVFFLGGVVGPAQRCIVGKGQAFPSVKFFSYLDKQPLDHKDQTSYVQEATGRYRSGNKYVSGYSSLSQQVFPRRQVNRTPGAQCELARLCISYLYNALRGATSFSNLGEAGSHGWFARARWRKLRADSVSVHDASPTTAADSVSTLSFIFH